MQILLVVCFRKCPVTHQCMIAAGVGAAAVVHQCRLHVHEASKTLRNLELIRKLTHHYEKNTQKNPRLISVLMPCAYVLM